MPRSSRIDRTCVQCKSVFNVPASRLKYGPALWCSNACRFSSRQWKDSLKVNRRENRTCLICLKSFLASKSDNGRKKFCSKKCLGIANGERVRQERLIPTIEKPCEECGKSMQVRSCLVKRKRFCSRACNALFHGRQRHIMRPTSIETALQNALRKLSIDFTPELRAGRYCIDIAIEASSIAVEADGTYWHSLAKQKIADARKTTFLQSQGWTVLRFTEDEINNDADECASKIRKAISD